MNVSGLRATVNVEAIGRELHEMIAQLYPICRSITGAGVRQTLDQIAEQIPLVVHEVPTGTRVFDWVVPKEWNIRDAYIKDPDGNKIVDFKKSNLHVVSYSVPVRKRISLAELRDHLHTLPDNPDWIPNRTSYYKETWGFCLSHKTLEELKEGEYEVCIDSSLVDGQLTYGECILNGTRPDEVLISTHVCHPSLCNDNLSGIAITAFLARFLKTCSLSHTYRFLFIPTTIGSITWLARNESRVSRIKHGLVLTCLGAPGGFTYKKSRRGDAAVDRACHYVLKGTGQPFEVLDFTPNGGDERQYCSPAFNLPVGVLMRTAHGHFPQYHTSADNLEFVTVQALGDALDKVLSIIEILEADRPYLSTNPKCEPHLGKRGLWLSGDWPFGSAYQQPLLWVLNYSDGEHSLLDIAERSGLPFDSVKQAADVLVKCSLLAEIPTSSPRTLEASQPESATGQPKTMDLARI